MAAIFRVKNKYGYSYKVLIRNKGLKDVIKTFKKRELAAQFINQIESNRELRISYSNNDLTLNDLISKTSKISTKERDLRLREEDYSIG